MVICLDGLSEKEKKAHLRFAFLYPKSFRLIKEEGKLVILKKLLNASLDADTNYWAKQELKKIKGVN